MEHVYNLQTGRMGESNYAKSGTELTIWSIVLVVVRVLRLIQLLLAYFMLLFQTLGALMPHSIYCISLKINSQRCNA